VNIPVAWILWDVAFGYHGYFIPREAELSTSILSSGNWEAA